MQDNDPMNEPLDLPDEQLPPAHHSYPMPVKSKHSMKAVYIIASLIVLAALVFGVKKLFLDNKPAPAANTTAKPKTTAAPPKDLPDATGTELYENGLMGLSLTRPKNWTVTETNDNGVRLESPVFSYPNLDNDDISGNFRVYIRKGARAVDGKYIGRGVAIEPSVKVIYKEPALGQRADTLVTNFGLDTNNNFAYFFVAGNFQLNAGDTLGPDYGKEPETFIISGGYSSKDLKDDMETNVVPADLIKTSNAYKQAMNIIESLQLH